MIFSCDYRLCRPDTMINLPEVEGFQGRIVEIKFRHQDAVVIGGGMVGAAVALGLAQLGLTVTVIERRRPRAYDESSPPDLRVSAVSLGSERLLERLGAWQNIIAMRNAPYLGLETWELDGFITQFSNQQLDLPHLGHIIENRNVQLGIWQELQTHDNVNLVCPANVLCYSRTDEQTLSVTLESGEVFHTHLLLGCDGADSNVRDWAGIGVTGWDYKQSAMLINVETQIPRQDVTWQQFTPQGPRSLLPLSGNHASLVWYDSPEVIAGLTRLDNIQLAEQIRRHFPERLDPDFIVLDKGAFSLTRRHANQYYKNNVVLLGDAAHTVNPLAGQGVNLGFKDVDALLAAVSRAVGDNRVWYETSVLKRYQKARYKDNLLMQTAMDVFYKSFSNDLAPVKAVRNLALKAANIDSPLKKRVLRYALGF